MLFLVENKQPGGRSIMLWASFYLAEEKELMSSDGKINGAKEDGFRDYWLKKEGYKTHARNFDFYTYK